MIKQIHAHVRGRVQGVSFRYATLQTAGSLGCTGWVRNNPDRSVECVAQGNQDQLEKFVAFLHEGPPAAIVQEVVVNWEEVGEALTDFQIT